MEAVTDAIRILIAAETRLRSADLLLLETVDGADPDGTEIFRITLQLTAKVDVIRNACERMSEQFTETGGLVSGELISDQNCDFIKSEYALARTRLSHRRYRYTQPCIETRTF